MCHESNRLRCMRLPEVRKTIGYYLLWYWSLR
nr:MAG TPA: hypothetical protein [Bacteriophage sp.]